MNGVDDVARTRDLCPRSPHFTYPLNCMAKRRLPVFSVNGILGSGFRVPAAGSRRVPLQGNQSASLLLTVYKRHATFL